MHTAEDEVCRKHAAAGLKLPVTAQSAALVDVGHGLDLLLAELALALLSLGALLPLQDLLAVLIHLQLADDDLAGINTNVDGRTIDLLPGDALNVDDPLSAVHLGHLALTALVGAANHGHLVILAHGDGAHPWVLLFQLSGERSAHELPALTGWRREVSLAALSPGVRHIGGELHGAFCFFKF
mmetsp:Transcript_17958/g.15872  ORF Transcript_17958/g.15872 Transcript_17958/m.15872 type:complete len:183 (-) Transcript_17958:6-554(-)